MWIMRGDWRRDGGVYVLTEETQYGWLARLGALAMPGRMSKWHQRWLGEDGGKGSAVRDAQIHQ
jgi:hypothetical protein